MSFLRSIPCFPTCSCISITSGSSCKQMFRKSVFHYHKPNKSLLTVISFIICPNSGAVSLSINSLYWGFVLFFSSCIPIISLEETIFNASSTNALKPPCRFGITAIESITYAWDVLTSSEVQPFLHRLTRFVPVKSVNIPNTLFTGSPASSMYCSHARTLTLFTNLFHTSANSTLRMYWIDRRNWGSWTMYSASNILSRSSGMLCCIWISSPRMGASPWENFKCTPSNSTKNNLFMMEYCCRLSEAASVGANGWLLRKLQPSLYRCLVKNVTWYDSVTNVNKVAKI